MHRYSLPTLAATEAFAALTAEHIRAGDCIALTGELGAGKTAFARAFIRALTTPDMEVPSPTYTLMQEYDSKRGQITHMDLYRIKHADELEELGFADVLAGGITLIEWPQVAEAWLPPTCLRFVFSHAGGDARFVDCNAPQEWYTGLTNITRD